MEKHNQALTNFNFLNTDKQKVLLDKKWLSESELIRFLGDSFTVMSMKFQPDFYPAIRKKRNELIFNREKVEEILMEKSAKYPAICCHMQLVKTKLANN